MIKKVSKIELSLVSSQSRQICEIARELITNCELVFAYLDKEVTLTLDKYMWPNGWPLSETRKYDVCFKNKMGKELINPTYFLPREFDLFIAGYPIEKDRCLGMKITRNGSARFIADFTQNPSANLSANIADFLDQIGLPLNKKNVSLSDIYAPVPTWALSPRPKAKFGWQTIIDCQ